MNNQHFVNKAFRIFVINSILSSAGVVLGTFVDAIILGNAFGAVGLSVLAVSMPIYAVYNLFGYAFGVGGSLRVSESIGAEDRDGVRSYFTQAMVFAAAVGVIIAVLGSLFLPTIIALTGGAGIASARDYMWPIVVMAPIFILAPVMSLLIRSDADPFLSTLGIGVSVAVNLVLDLIFIFGLKMGVFGGALAMIIGQLCAVFIYSLHFFKKHNHLKLSRTSLSPKAGAQLFQGGFGIASAFIYQGITLIVINNLLSVTAGGGGLGVYNILFNVSLFAYAIFDGISLALAPLVATFAGEKDTEGVYNTMGLSLKTAVLLSASCALALLIFAEPIASMFGVADNLPLVAQTIRIFAFGVVQTCFNCIMAHFYQTIKRPSLAGLIYFMRGLLLLVAFSAWFIPVFGVLGTALAMVAAETATMVILLIAALVIKKQGGYRNILLFREPIIAKDKLYETTLSSDIKELENCVVEIEAFCERLDIDSRNAYFINLTIEELATNIINFGFSDGKSHYIHIKIALFEEDIYIRLRDDSTSYNPFEEPEKPDEGLDYLGVSIVRKKAKSFAYNRTLVFNNLLIIL
ncbi:MATE family efflux transporter [Acetobacterium carbinolicum]|uniref:MATE family efflux transporter n=1 Tax=Acetobacterium carbinolicum TaxID=52690 RepID=UPI0039BFD133